MSTSNPSAPQFFGKYRATVVSNVDPENRGRLQLSVPDVLALIPSTWAECCAPFSGATGAAAGFFAIPAIGATVWVEFEKGDSNRPIWTGGRWPASADVPATALAPPPLPLGQNVVLQTTLQNMLSVSDAIPTPNSGGIILKSAGGAKIVVNDTGIYIDNGSGATIELVSSAVLINKAALVIK